MRLEPALNSVFLECKYVISLLPLSGQGVNGMAREGVKEKMGRKEETNKGNGKEKKWWMQAFSPAFSGLFYLSLHSCLFSCPFCVLYFLSNCFLHPVRLFCLASHLGITLWKVSFSILQPSDEGPSLKQLHFLSLLPSSSSAMTKKLQPSHFKRSFPISRRILDLSSFLCILLTLLSYSVLGTPTHSRAKREGYQNSGTSS